MTTPVLGSVTLRVAREVGRRVEVPVDDHYLDFFDGDSRIFAGHDVFSAFSRARVS